jgi:hypothetical protein
MSAPDEITNDKPHGDPKSYEVVTRLALDRSLYICLLPTNCNIFNIQSPKYLLATQVLVSAITRLINLSIARSDFQERVESAVSERDRYGKDSLYGCSTRPELRMPVE